jgi:type II secretion system protein N
MKRARPLVICAYITAALFLLVSLTVLFIPTRIIRDVIDSSLQNKGLTMQAAYFGKAFPLGIKARDLEIGDARGGLVKLDDAVARISLPALLTGRVVVNYHADIGNGSIEGDFSRSRDTGFSFHAKDVRLEDIPFFQTVTGARVKGNLQADALFQEDGSRRSGEMRLLVKGAVLNGVKIGGMPLPDASYETIQGMYRLNGARGTLESLSLQGKGIYMRLKGDIPFISPPGSAPLNLTLELMPKPSFLENQKFIFLLLIKYLTTPGHYQIPIRGTLAKPLIQ